MKKLPKLWRRKKGGREIGAFYVTVRDQPVNLGTQDATLAIKRRAEALKGKRKFDEDADAAADGIAAIVGGAPPPAPPPAEPLALAPVPEQAPPPADAPPSATPDEVIPPPAEGWAETVGAAADAAAGEGAGAPGPDGAPVPPGFTITMDDIAKILGLPAEQLAPVAVDLQVKAGEWIGRLAGYEVAPIQPNDMGRMMLSVGYVPVIRLLQASDMNVHPGWFILAGSIMIATAQMAGAKKIAKKTPEEAAAEKAAA